MSSVLWGIAPILQALIFIRVLQGTIGGGLQPLSQAVWLEEFFPEQCGEAMVFWELEVTWGSPRTKVVATDSRGFLDKIPRASNSCLRDLIVGLNLQGLRTYNNESMEHWSRYLMARQACR